MGFFSNLSFQGIATGGAAALHRVARAGAALICAWAGAVDGMALILPLAKEPYDETHNKVTLQEAWARGHRVGVIHGMGGTPIAPRWAVTAGHCADIGPRVFDYKGSHQIEERVLHPQYFRPKSQHDIALVRIKGTFPDYAPLQKSRAPSGTELVAYGVSTGYPTNAFKNAAGDIIGWNIMIHMQRVPYISHARFGKITSHEYLAGSSHIFRWDFQHGPVAALNDSGTGVFNGENLCGFFATGGAASCIERAGRYQNVWLFDARTITNSCNGYTNVAQQAAVDIVPYLPWIYSVISPPVRLDAGGKSAEDWKAWDPAEAYSTREDIPVSGLEDAAPAEVYRSISYKDGRGINALAFSAGDLLKSERYTVRLHFSGIRFLEAQVMQNISINGTAVRRRHDPLALPGGPGKASVLTISNVPPNAGNEIAVRLEGSEPGAAVSLSGVEILRQ
jgi:hypothetical protein